MLPDFSKKSFDELLSDYVSILDELRARRVVRSENIPTGDLAEYLFCKAFDWVQEPNSKKAFDATDLDGRRYQIKGCRLHRRTRSRQLSAIRSIDDFDTLAAVLFDHHYRVLRAALIPVATVKQHVTYVGHTNSNKFILRDEIWSIPGVEDVTEQLISVYNA